MYNKVKDCSKGGQHEWGTDGLHSNQFCKKCFIDFPPEDNKVKELVEWVAERLWGFLIANAPSWEREGSEYSIIHESLKGWMRGVANQILSHPDLALIDRELEKVKIAYNEMDIELCTCPPVIPLAEALKEEK